MGPRRARVVDLPCGLCLLAGAFALMLSGCASQSVEAPERVTIQVDGAAAADRLSEAIRVKTISAALNTKTEKEDAAFGKFHELLQRSFPRVHGALEREIVNDRSLLYTWQGTDQSLKPILFAAHMDVVPVEDGTEGQWSQKPFSGTTDEQGTIWGRGTLDDKLSVLGLLEAVEILVKKGFTPRRTIYLAFGHDEELEGEFGAKEIATMLEQGGTSLEYVLDEGSIIGDGLVDGVEKPVAMIGVAEKGYLSIELTAKAKGGHSSIPPEETAIGRLARAIDRLQNNPLPAEIRPPVSDMLEALAPEMPTFQRIAMQNQWLFGGLVTSLLTGVPTSNAMVRTTTAPTIIEGGTKDNVLPQKASATVNFRVLPGDSLLSVMRHVKQTIDDGLIKIAPIEESASEPVMPSNTNSESYRVVAQTVREIFPEAVVAPALVIAATDSRHYQNVTENIFRFLPVTLTEKRLNGMHGNNERLETEKYERLIAFYIQLMKNSNEL